MPNHKWIRRFELLLWAVASVCFISVGWSAVAAIQSGSAADRVVKLGSLTGGAAASVVTQAHGEIRSVDRPADVTGRLRIQALGLSVPMTAGTESSSLLRGVGHVDGTASPGGLGTLGLAGHRDTYLRPLERVAPGMDIEVTDASGTYHYIVDSSEIVTPEQIDVLAIRGRPELALITCFPFHYIGPAPKRFVVHAHLASLSPDAPSAKSPGTVVNR